MTNPKGTAAETAVVNWAKLHGFPHAVRLVKAGVRDLGDVRLTPLGAPRQVVVEVKNYKAAGTGQPPAGMLAKWMAEVTAEKSHAEADVAFLVVKRKGTTNVGAWWAFIELRELLEMACVIPTVWHAAVNGMAGSVPVCLPVEAMTSLLQVDTCPP